MSDYRCGTCQDGTLVVIPRPGGGWKVECGNGHEWTPVGAVQFLLAGPPTSEPLGTIVVDEVVLDIWSLWFGGGKLHMQAKVPGPVVIRAPSEYRVHGPDGSLMYTSIWPAEIGTVRVERPGDSISVTLDIDMKPWGREALDRFYAGARP